MTNPFIFFSSLFILYLAGALACGIIAGSPIVAVFWPFWLVFTVGRAVVFVIVGALVIYWACKSLAQMFDRFTK